MTLPRFLLAAALILLVSPLAKADEPTAAQAIAEIKRLGGVYQHEDEKPDKPVIGVNLVYTKASDSSIKLLKALPKIRWLGLAETGLTDEGLEALKGLTELQTLYLNNAKITDKGLESLKGMTKLETLGIAETAITDKGLEHLKGLKSLRRLYVPSGVSADACAELRKAIPGLSIVR